MSGVWWSAERQQWHVQVRQGYFLVHESYHDNYEYAVEKMLEILGKFII